MRESILSLTIDIADIHASIPFGEEIGFQYAWLVLAFVNLILFVPFMALKWCGPWIREKSWQAPPTFNRDL
jgi:hypothetical protein